MHGLTFTTISALSALFWSTMHTFAHDKCKDVAISLTHSTYVIFELAMLPENPSVDDASRLFAISLGYFYHEVVSNLQRGRYANVTHGVICSLAYWYILASGAYARLGAYYLVLELSTPFYNFWRMARARGRCELAWLRTFKYVFFMVRVVYLSFLTRHMWVQDIPSLARAGGVLFAVLNLAWMVSLAQIQPKASQVRREVEIKIN